MLWVVVTHLSFLIEYVLNDFFELVKCVALVYEFKYHSEYVLGIGRHLVYFLTSFRRRFSSALQVIASALGYKVEVRFIDTDTGEIFQ